MKLIFIRHADPDYENNTLTKKGFLEAEALGKHYCAKDFDYIYCSPLPRAKLTCDAVIKGEKEVIIKPWLEEFWHPLTINGINWGNWDLMPSFVEKESHYLFDNSKYLDSEVMETGEVKKHYKIVTEEFDKILAEHGYIRKGINYFVEKPNEDTIVFFSHLGLISTLISHLIHIPYWQVAQYFCLLASSVTTFVSEEREEGIGQFRCLSLSNTSHLEKEGLEPSFAARYRETRYNKERK